MKKALVHIALVVDGERKVFAPGDELPEMSKHDDKELTKSKSISDPAAEEAAEKDEAAEQRAGQRAFNATKKAVQAAAASTES